MTAMTAEALKVQNKKALAQLAKDLGIAGWHAMRKDQLIRALSPEGGALPVNLANERPGAPLPKPDRLPQPAPRPSVSVPHRANGNGNGAHHQSAAPPLAPPRPLPMPPSRSLDHGCQTDRIVVVVRDPYWLHAYWELSRATLDRAKAAMGQDWHAARPILRLYDVSSEDTTSSAERCLRDVVIHGDVNNWYVDVTNPPKSYRIDVGYLSARGKFFVLAKSNVVSTPKARIGDLPNNAGKMSFEPVNGSQSEQDARVTAQIKDLLERQLHRPMSNGGFSMQAMGNGALPSFGRDFHFSLDAELVVYGVTEPNSKVTLQGEPVKVRPDGTFTVRFSLPDSRVIIPAVASSPDGVEERTIVLAVERNTKQLEPQIHDGNEL